VEGSKAELFSADSYATGRLYDGQLLLSSTIRQNRPIEITSKPANERPGR
jgi:hypothetical protein